MLDFFPGSELRDGLSMGSSLQQLLGRNLQISHLNFENGEQKGPSSFQSGPGMQLLNNFPHNTSGFGISHSTLVTSKLQRRMDQSQPNQGTASVILLT